MTLLGVVLSILELFFMQVVSFDKSIPALSTILWRAVTLCVFKASHWDRMRAFEALANAALITEQGTYPT